MIGGSRHDRECVGSVVAREIDEALPHGGGRTGVVRGAGDVFKGEIVRLPFHRFREPLPTPNICGNCAEHRARRTCENGGTERTLHALCGMILLTVSHLMCKNYGDFVLV